MDQEGQKNQLNKELFELNKRLGVVISLLLRMIPEKGNGLSLKEQVGILSNLSIRPRDIANILGRTQTHISKELTGIRKEKYKKHE